MTLAIVYSRASIGMSAPLVTVEVHLSPGVPKLNIVGLPETAVKESKDRVRSALMNAHFKFPTRRITINLAPADLPKEGGRFDLPIALGILAASGQLPAGKLREYEFVGELALSGELRAVRGVLPVVLSAQQAKRRLIVPEANVMEAALVKQTEVFSAEHLLEVCAHLKGEMTLPRCEVLQSNVIEQTMPDLADVCGQPHARRALEIAAAGKHSLLFIGSPGTGKTMLASRLPGILPLLSEQQSLEVAALASISRNGFDYTQWQRIPFRSPHHSSSSVALVGEKHYDLGNNLFHAMLDRNMNYTCAYWKNANNLDEAQLAKLDLVCRKLQLQPGMRVLDIGCGWGAFAKYAAENYGVEVTGVTISLHQYEYAKENCKNLLVQIYYQDYRDLSGKFDRIASLGMFEHVGHLNYGQYMRVVEKLLTDDGIFLLHTIGSNISVTTADEWITKYIFPNGMLPSIAQIGRASENLFIMEDWHNFGAYYDKTLMAWSENFQQHWDELKNQYDERFFRMWNYYLFMCAGVFRARQMQLWQIVFSKNGIAGGYEAAR